MISIYSKLSDNDINIRKMEQLDKWGKIVQYGRQNPVWFIENVFRYPLFDYQKYMVMGGWTAPRCVYVQSRASGKSFIAGIIIMTKSVLYPNFVTCIMAPGERQSRDLFDKIQKIATKNIATMVGTDVFINELIKPNGNPTGFVTASGDAHFSLYNGSSVTALNSSENKVVGKRSNLNVYDEAGKISQNYFALTEPFIAVKSDFKTGVDLSVYPKNVPNQCMYFSSAEDTSTHLWDLYKTGAKHMMMGLKDYFVCDVTCEMPLNPTMNGKRYAPLFERSEVEEALRSNEYRARREYYNLFDLSGGSDSIVSSDAIYRAEKQFVPLTANPDPKSGKKYIITIDPAHQLDNSFCLITEARKEKSVGWVGRFVNGYNMVKTLPNGDKKLYTMPEAVEFIRDLMVRYNGNEPDWGNIILFVDPGSGGGGLMIADYLRQDWTDKYGNKYPGVIDLQDEKSAQERINFPNAVPNVLHLYSPQKFKNAMFSALTEMFQQSLIELPAPAPRGTTAYFDDGEVELTTEDLRGLVELDMLKEEVKRMRKIITDKGNAKYGLAPSVENKMHDDRASVA